MKVELNIKNRILIGANNTIKQTLNNTIRHWKTQTNIH